MWFRRECRRVESLLWTIGKETADSRQTARAQAHLRHCPACRAQWLACQQTQTGLAALRDRPVPTSQTDWHTVQARLAAASGIPAVARNTRGELARHRVAIAGRGALLTGSACILALCLLTRSNILPREAEPSVINGKLDVTKAAQSLRPFKPKSQFAAITLVDMKPASVTAFPISLSGFSPTAERQGRRRNWMPHIRRVHTRPYDRRAAMARAGRRRRMALALLHRRMQSSQVAPNWNNADEEIAASGLAVTIQAGRMEPEYVLTTAEGVSSTPRSFIMDSINVDAQHTGQANVDGLAVPAASDDVKRNLNNGLNSRQQDTQHNVPSTKGNAQAVKEIEAW